jgi:hypothetical protein
VQLERGCPQQAVFQPSGHRDAYIAAEPADDVQFVAAFAHALEHTGGSLELKIGTSPVFRKLNGRWRQTHHHGSMDDPAMLATCQGLVLAKTGA